VAAFVELPAVAAAVVTELPQELSCGSRPPQWPELRRVQSSIPVAERESSCTPEWVAAYKVDFTLSIKRE